MHNSRVRLTFHFLNRAGTSFNLLVILKVISIPHIIMRWLMIHESRLRPKELTRLQVAMAYVKRSSSPIWDALEVGSKLLDDAYAREWECAMALSHAEKSATLRDIWKTMLPVLGRVYMRSLVPAETWPLRLLLLLLDSSADTVRQQVAEEFATTRPCCIPDGIKVLHSSIRCPEDCFNVDVLTTVEELGRTIDFTNYDQELKHAHMRTSLSLCQGKCLGLGSACLLHMGSSIGRDHDYENPGRCNQPSKRGRPVKALGGHRYAVAERAFWERTRNALSGMRFLNGASAKSSPGTRFPERTFRRSIWPRSAGGTRNAAGTRCPAQLR